MTRTQALAVAVAQDHWEATVGNRKDLDRFLIWTALFRWAGVPA